MTSIHAGNAPHPNTFGFCRWINDPATSWGIFLYCSARALPLGELCVTHLLEWAAAQPAEYFITRDRIAAVKR